MKYKFILKSGKEFTVQFAKGAISPIVNFIAAPRDSTMSVNNDKGEPMLVIVLSEIAVIEELLS